MINIKKTISTLLQFEQLLKLRQNDISNIIVNISSYVVLSIALFTQLSISINVSTCISVSLISG